MCRGVGRAGGDCQLGQAQLLQPGQAGLWDLESRKSSHRSLKRVAHCAATLCKQRVTLTSLLLKVWNFSMCQAQAACETNPNRTWVLSLSLTNFPRGRISHVVDTTRC